MGFIYVFFELAQSQLETGNAKPTYKLNEDRERFMLMIALLVSLVCGMACSHIAERKHLNGKLHSILGVVFGPIGLFYSLLAPRKNPTLQRNS